jgi:hypothetical protein
MKSTNTPKNAVLSTPSKKIDLKAPIKVTKVVMPRLASNHNETLLMA